MANIILYLLLTFLVVLAIIFLSLLTNDEINKILAVIGLLVIVIVFITFTGNFELGVIYAFIIGSVLIASLSGGVIALLFMGLFDLLIYDTNLLISEHIIYLLFIITAMGAILQYFEREVKEDRKLILNLTGQVKEMRALREISALLQGTIDLDTLLHIILSAVTAGYGLEFNRAILFLKKENQLYGKLGIGPLSKKGGLLVWQRVAEEKTDLNDMIEMKEEVTLDEELNDIVREFSFDLQQDNLASRVVNNKKPINVKEIDPKDQFQSALQQRLNCKNFAILPLIVQEKVIGLLVVDNIANEREITYRDIDSLLPFANQAALAIENARLYKLKDEMAIKDNLTQLYNQRYFQTSLEEAVKEAREKESTFALLMIDIDYFKVYNDNNGHPAGNKALINLSSILSDNVREDDIVCRFGGEEFAVILPRTDKELALTVAERLRQRVEDYEFKYQNQQPNNNLTISIGVAIFPDDAESGREILNKADKSLYQAKDTGRNKVEYYKSKAEK